MSAFDPPQLIEFEIILKVDTYNRPPFWIIGPRSYFSDRAMPQIEVSVVPARKMDAAKAVICARPHPRETDSYLRGVERVTSQFNAYNTHLITPDRYYIDLRPFGLGNWSHCLNAALPFAVFIRDHLSRLGQSAPIVILNQGGISSKVRGLFEVLGLQVLCTNTAVKAPLITLSCSTSHFIHQKSREFVAPISPDISNFVGSTEGVSEKVFLNRKSSRSLKNNKEIIGLLTKHGYQEVFMEDHTIEAQFAILLGARNIVAIHGAALAPLLFRNPEHGPFSLIEINTPGHIVPFFRDMVTKLPCEYRLVRGIPDQKMALAAFQNVGVPDMAFTNAHSLTSFAVDPFSVEVALESLRSNNFPANVIDL
jgi:hypothetical protein